MASNVLSVSHMRAAFITGFGGEDIFEFTNEVENVKFTNKTSSFQFLILKKMKFS